MKHSIKFSNIVMGITDIIISLIFFVLFALILLLLCAGCKGLIGVLLNA